MVTRRAVCLLRSRRRTFLFGQFFPKNYMKMIKLDPGGASPPLDPSMHAAPGWNPAYIKHDELQ